MVRSQKARRKQVQGKAAYCASSAEWRGPNVGFGCWEQKSCPSASDPVAVNDQCVQLLAMSNQWILSLFLALALCGCNSSEQAEGSGSPIAGHFRFAFEVSSIDLCSAGTANDNASCQSDGAACWLVFSRTASDDLTAITGSDQFTEEGFFWIEGRGRVSREDKKYGHLGQYPCEVEMTSVNVFSKLAR